MWHVSRRTLRVCTGKQYIDEKLAEIQRREEARQNESDVTTPERTDLLTFMLANQNLSREEVYANVTEILLSGIDTVSSRQQLWRAALVLCRGVCRGVVFTSGVCVTVRVSGVADVEQPVLLALPAVAPPRRAGAPGRRGTRHRR